MSVIFYSGGGDVKELDFLRRMWTDVNKYTQGTKKEASRLKKRITIEKQLELIAPVIYENNQPKFNTEHWAYVVPFAFREALDICYDKRQKDNQFYLVWTQGCLLNFSIGDMFQSNRGEPQLQIQKADPMVWDAVNGSMNEGSVTFEHFFDKSIPPRTVTQMEFLGILIEGLNN